MAGLGVHRPLGYIGIATRSGREDPGLAANPGIEHHDDLHCRLPVAGVEYRQFPAGAIQDMADATVHDLYYFADSMAVIGCSRIVGHLGGFP